MKPILFIATYPNKQGLSPAYMAELDDTYTLLHPSFDFDSDKGRAAVDCILTTLPLPIDTNLYRQLCLRDAWGVKVSQTLVYDLDIFPGSHFLSVAAENKIPIIAVSSTLKEVPAYFSGFVTAVTKPDTLRHLLNIYLPVPTEPQDKLPDKSP